MPCNQRDDPPTGRLTLLIAAYAIEQDLFSIGSPDGRAIYAKVLIQGQGDGLAAINRYGEHFQVQPVEDAVTAW